jgi:hypothetical protein
MALTATVEVAGFGLSELGSVARKGGQALSGDMLLSLSLSGIVDISSLRAV